MTLLTRLVHQVHKNWANVLIFGKYSQRCCPVGRTALNFHRPHAARLFSHIYPRAVISCNPVTECRLHGIKYPVVKVGLAADRIFMHCESDKRGHHHQS